MTTTSLKIYVWSIDSKYDTTHSAVSQVGTSVEHARQCVRKGVEDFRAQKKAQDEYCLKNPHSFKRVPYSDTIMPEFIGSYTYLEFEEEDELSWLNNSPTVYNFFSTTFFSALTG